MKVGRPKMMLVWLFMHNVDERQKGVVEAARRRSYDIILILKQENKYRGKSLLFHRYN